VRKTTLLAVTFIAWNAAAQPAPSPQPDNASTATKRARSQDPSNFIEVIEEIGNERILHYYPDAVHDLLRSRQFKVDLGSTLLIRIVPDRLSPKAALSNLIITAQLKHASTTTNVEVKGYSVVGQSQTSGQSQTAVNSNSITNVISQMENLFFVAQLILQQANPDCLTAIQGSTAPLFDSAVQTKCSAATKIPDLSKPFNDYQAEIGSFATFFTDPQNAFLQTYFANKFFGMDLASVQSVAKEFQTTLALSQSKAASNGGAPATTVKPDYTPLLLRTVLAYEDIWTEIVRFPDPDTIPVKEVSKMASLLQPWAAKKAPIAEQIQAVVDAYFDGLPGKLFQELQQYLVDGQIILTDYKGQPGDVLSVTIEAKPAATPNNNNPAGAVFQLQIGLDGFGMSVGPSSSLFFLKRVGVPIPSSSTTTPPNPQPVNFAPSPGASFGFTFRYRNYGKCDEPDRAAEPGRAAEQVCADNSKLGIAPDKVGKFNDLHPNYMRKENGGFGQLMRALAPGLSMNVSFMNWNSPTDFDATTGKFTSSAAASIQVGAGVVASLFDNQIQFTYGWNLQVPQNRQYWGVGFGFVEIGKTLAGYAKAKASSTSQ